MTDNVIFPDWKEFVVYSEKGMQPQVLVETKNYKSVVAGMAPGNAMPAHAEGPAIFHFLEGSGKMIVARGNPQRGGRRNGSGSRWGQPRN